MEITMETKKAKSMQTEVTVESLKEMNSKDLQKTATQLGIKNSKKYAKTDLLKACIKALPKNGNGTEKKTEAKVIALPATQPVEQVDTEVAVAEEIPSTTTTEQKEVVKVDVTKFPTFIQNMNGEGKDFYQYYPYKKKFEGKLLSVFRKKNADGKGSTCWIEDSEGKKIFESKSWDESYFKAIKLRNEEYKDAKVVVYFDSEIPLPGSYGKTYN